tara:strand:- start:288 stop:656 length:369 start_codon:yes stop_codon:yes gene_type:complete
MSLLINKITRPSLTINWMSSKLKIHPSLFYVAGAIGILSVFQPSLGQFAMLFWLGSILFELALPIHLNVLLELIYFNLIYALIQLLPHKSFDGHLMFKSIAEYKHIQKTLSINSFSVNLNKA